MPPPARRPFDERDDYDDQPRRQGMNPGVIVALVVGGVLLLGCIACAGLGLLGWMAAPVAQGPPVAVQGGPVGGPGQAKTKAAEGKRVYIRDEFRQLVMGKTPDEVLAAVGRPDETAEGGGVTRWTYRDRVRAAPGEGAASPVVVFRDGKAAEVVY
jgi:hypothetical protein